jgi:hypothetical protein
VQRKQIVFINVKHRIVQVCVPHLIDKIGHLPFCTLHTYYLNTVQLIHVIVNCTVKFPDLLGQKPFQNLPDARITLDFSSSSHSELAYASASVQRIS